MYPYHYRSKRARVVPMELLPIPCKPLPLSIPYYTVINLVVNTITIGGVSVVSAWVVNTIWILITNSIGGAI